MKAAYYTGNKRLTIESVQPAEPAEGQVRIRVSFCGICGSDLHIFHGALDDRVGSRRVIGHEMSGRIDALGADVLGIEPGDPVVVRPLAACGGCPACQRGHAHICQNLKVIGVDLDGAFQQICTVPADTIHRIPDDLPLKHAALVEPVAVACHDVRRARLAGGEDTLIIGGGPIGMVIAMVARHMGANVILSEVNAYRLELAQSLGFNTLNPRKVNVADEIHARTAGKGADVIFEVAGTQAGVDTMTAAAATRCRIVLVAIHSTRPSVDLFRFFEREIELLGARVYEPDDFNQAIELVASGAIDCDALITDVRPLEEINAAFEALSGNAPSMKSLIKL